MTGLGPAGAQRFLQEHGEVQLSALGVAISSMVTLAEILKNKQLAVETRIVTSLEEISSDSRWVPSLAVGACPRHLRWRGRTASAEACVLKNTFSVFPEHSTASA